MKKQCMLLRMFLVLNESNCREYQRALSTSISIWEWMKSINHPCWQLFKNNASAFNEESGEICFSVLAREISGSGVRSDCQAVSSKFRIIKTKIDVANDLKFELCGDDFASKKHKVIRADSDEVKTTAYFFQRTIRQIVSKAFRHYGPDCGVLDAKARRAKTPRKTVPLQVVPKLHGDVTETMRGVVDAQRTKLNGFWVHHHKDIWPGAQPQHEESSDSEESGDPASGARGSDGPKTPDRRRKRRRLLPESEKSTSLVGRVVAVPGWCLGERWADRAWGSRRAARQSRLHGVLEKGRNYAGLSCRFWHDENYVLNLTRAQIKKFLVPVAEEGKVSDTPYHPDYNPEE